jgi:transposase
MPVIKKLEVKEDAAELRRLYRRAAHHLKPRIKMLLIAVEEAVHAKRKLARRLNVDPNSIQTWKTAYQSGGLEELLRDKRICNRSSVVDKKTHNALQVKLTNPLEAPRSYKELQQWVEEHHLPGINYQTLRGYVQRHFGTKIKVVRKSHIKKDKEAVEQFKKKSQKK